MSLFQTELIQQEERNYERLELAPEHRPMMEGIAKILGQFLEISHIALKGFIWRSLKQLQVDHNVTIEEIASMTPQERGKYAIEAFDSLRGFLYKILRNTEDKTVIDEAVNKGIEFYKQNFMNR